MKIGYDFHQRRNSFNILTTGKVIDSYKVQSDINKLNDALLIAKYESTQHASFRFQYFLSVLDEILFLLDQAIILLSADFG